ncbi:MAG: metalloregulator ArsR/SmtB family transcription factor [Saprospiraceae bacterium]|nr:metalloregulator ArsR/SmtB family transcription factor [Saprospiraceae bacterium]
MAFNKAHKFARADQQRALLCKALSHPARIVMIRQLMEHDTLRASVLGHAVPLSQPATSQHLQLLHQTGLVERKEEYPNVYYRMAPELPDWKQRILLAVVQ